MNWLLTNKVTGNFIGVVFLGVVIVADVIDTRTRIAAGANREVVTNG